MKRFNISALPRFIFTIIMAVFAVLSMVISYVLCWLIRPFILPAGHRLKAVGRLLFWLLFLTFVAVQTARFILQNSPL
jgi:hypothetical protein